MKSNNLSHITDILATMPEYQKLIKQLNKKSFDISAQFLPEGFIPFINLIISNLNYTKLVIVPDITTAEWIESELNHWNNTDYPILFLPEPETVPYEISDPRSRLTQQYLSHLSTIDTTQNFPVTIVLSLPTLLRKIIDPKIYKANTVTLKLNQELSMKAMTESWQNSGYERTNIVESLGSFCTRGGIIDIFPTSTKTPIRIELLGNQIESIRSFDPSTQISIEHLQSIIIPPAREILPNFDSSVINNPENFSKSNQTKIEDHINSFLSASILDYLPKSSLIISINPSEQISIGEKTKDRFEESKPTYYPDTIFSWNTIQKELYKYNKFINISTTTTSIDELSIPVLQSPVFSSNINEFVDYVDIQSKEEKQIFIHTTSPNRIKSILQENLSISQKENDSSKLIINGQFVTILENSNTSCPSGLIIKHSANDIILLTDKEIFGRSYLQQKFPSTSSNIKTEEGTRSLTKFLEGDYVVHNDHGIAKFIGLGTPPSTNNPAEHVILEYANNDKLYVPLEYINRITAYVGMSDHSPSLSLLGGQQWEKSQQKVRESMESIASDLLQLYADRNLNTTDPIGSDSPWQSELEDSFPYTETSDQLLATEDVKKDMEQTTPMDRLICGDVGFGKTEIAIRAAFKAVMDNKQVAILVPTTILAEQHYTTFLERLAPYPITIESLSRLKSTKAQQNILTKIKSGQLDICIGTHRLVQKDVVFNNLGLVIIDEEQRFGVTHKEKLKQLKNNVHVLTLTATPIPRTLHLALSGIRDISKLRTPPEHLKPIKTYLVKSEKNGSNNFLKEAIYRELDRQGQIFILHNQIPKIPVIFQQIQRLIPDAKIGIAHGQMDKDNLAKTMNAFSKKLIDILICTTIIESGLDIPNANTLVINNAETFGLSQLYQLRGRVGRSQRTGYCYLVTKDNTSISSIASKRINTIVNTTTIGSGFEIALRDLEIRGTGNILGLEQSGYIHSIGLNLYTELLYQTVSRTKEREKSQSINVMPLKSTIKLNLSSYIPEDYIQDISIRIEIYQKIANINNNQSIKNLKLELKDRFGKLPIPLENMIYISILQIEAAKAEIKSIIQKNNTITIRIYKPVIKKIENYLQKSNLPILFKSNQIILDINQYNENQWMQVLQEIIQKLNTQSSNN